MTLRNSLTLGLAALVVLLTALLLTWPRTTSYNQSTTLYPDLKGNLSSITAVRIYTAGDERAVELVRNESQWQVTERANYPADTAKVRGLVQSIAEAKRIEEKTSNPQNYPTLGVEDLENPTATGARVELVGSATPVNLIIGKAAGVKGSYVRRAGEPESWLTNDTIEASIAPREWLDTSLLGIPANRVQSVAIDVKGAKPYSLTKPTRETGDFQVEGLPKGKQAEAYAIANIAGALANLTLTDVRAAGDFDAEEHNARATFRTFDGLIIELRGWVLDDKHYLSVEAAHDPALAERFAPPQADEAEATQDNTDAAVEARTLNSRVAGWIYEIADYKYEAIFKPADSLLKK